MNSKIVITFKDKTNMELIVKVQEKLFDQGFGWMPWCDQFITKRPMHYIKTIDQSNIAYGIDFDFLYSNTDQCYTYIDAEEFLNEKEKKEEVDIMKITRQLCGG